MKVDVDDGFAVHVVAHVYLNGRRITKCAMADEENGIVHIFKHYEDGSYFLKDGKPVREEFAGEVRIVLHEDWELNNGKYKFKGNL